MIQRLLLISIIGIHFSYLSQNPASHCFFGDVGLDFRTEPPTILESNMLARESAATISDEMGELLYYSNGGESRTASYAGGVWDFNGNLIQNGILADSSGCGSSYYGAIFFPAPGETDLYYLFKRDCVESSFSGNNYNAGLTYSIIDATANNGNAAIIEKNQQVVPFYNGGSVATSHEPLAATFHENGQDVWLFSYTKDSIYTVKIDENGPQFIQTWDEAIRRICVSPDGKHLIAGKKLYAFNKTSGVLTFIHEYTEMLSGEFSPDGRLLYLMEEDQKLNQYDLNVSHLNAEEIASFDQWYRMFLAPNYKIYLYEQNANEFAGVIQCPNEIGQDAGLSMNSFSLQGGQIFQAFTNILSNYLYNDNIRCTASLSDQNRINFSIYPNPSENGKIYLEGIDYPSEIVILSQDGKIIYHETHLNKNSFIHLSNLNKGVYTLQVNNDKGLGYKKLIVN